MPESNGGAAPPPPASDPTQPYVNGTPPADASPNAPTLPSPNTPTRVTPGGAEPSPPTQHAVPGWRQRFPRAVGPYELLEELGHGGMGVVFLARHERLRTRCAVKVLIAGEHASPDAIARFTREAEATARMGKHPNIVTVHDLGWEGNLAYYAMELVVGRSLRAAMAARDMPLPESVAVLEKVARALHFAHQRGIIHRDVKPENIILRSDGEPQVMDFGLAHDVEATRQLTSAGDVMGSPHYMAPEQVLGQLDAIDARTDVFALGAVLYEVLCGVRAHPGNATMEVFGHILRGEVVSPRRIDPRVSRDLETVCLKCLDPDPAARYASAEALADDLARFRRGEPVLARPVSLAYRAWKRVRRHQVASALTSLLLLALAAVAVLRWQQGGLVRQYLAELSERGRVQLSEALARRAIGDLKGCRRSLEALATPIEELKRRAPELAEPWYYQGCMESALERFEDAEASQDCAVSLARAAGDESKDLLPLALYERGLLRFARYTTRREAGRKRLHRLRETARAPMSASSPVPTTAEVEAADPDLARLRGAALDDLIEVVRSQGGSEELDARAHVARGAVAMIQGAPGAEEHFLRALELDPYFGEALTSLAGLAFEAGEWDEAARRFRNAHEKDRGAVSNLSAEARCLLTASQAAEARGEDAQARRDRALAAIQEAMDLVPASAELFGMECEVRLEEAERLRRHGKGSSAPLDAAFKPIEQAIALRPKDASLRNRRALLLLMRGEASRVRGEDPTADHAAAREACHEAIALDPALAEAHGNLGDILFRMAEWREDRDEDPSALLEEAAAAYGEMLRIDPGHLGARTNQACIAHALGERKAAKGQDPSEEFRRAGEMLEAVLAEAPQNAGALNNHAMLLVTLGKLRAGRGEDPSSEYGRAIEEYGRALASDAGIFEAAINLMTTWAVMGDWKADRGIDPTTEYGKAIEASRRARAINPGSATLLDNLAGIHASLGEWLSEHAGDPTAAFESALVAYREELTIDESRVEAYRGRAEVLRRRGEWKHRAEGDPTTDWQDGLKDLERARALKPNDASVERLTGGLYHRLGERKEFKGEDPREEWRQALDWLGKSIAHDPSSAPGRVNEATVHESLAVWKEARAEDPAEEYRKVVEGCEAALSLDPRLELAAQKLGDAWLGLGARNLKRGEAVMEEVQRALAAYDRAVAIRTDNWVVHLRRGVALEMLARLEEAVASYESGLRLRPEDPNLKAGLKSARGRLEARRASASEWSKAFDEGWARMAKGDYAGSRESYERGLRTLEEEWAPLPEAERANRLAAPGVRDALLTVHYNLACDLAQTSVGKTGPKAEPAPIEPSASARLRDEAFGHLEEALKLGLSGAAQASTDNDLAPLHDDPRWKALLERMR